MFEELIRLAKQMREANTRGEALGLLEGELAFYDAQLGTHCTGTSIRILRILRKAN